MRKLQTLRARYLELKFELGGGGLFKPLVNAIPGNWIFIFFVLLFQSPVLFLLALLLFIIILRNYFNNLGSFFF